MAMFEGGVVGRLRRWLTSVFTCCITLQTETQSTTQYCHPSATHRPASAASPVVCPTNIIHIRPSDRKTKDVKTDTDLLPIQECNVDQLRRNPTIEDSISDSNNEDVDIYNGQTEFWDLVFCKGDTDHIEKIVRVDLDKAIDSTEASNGLNSSSSKHEYADHRCGQEDVLEGGNGCIEIADHQWPGPEQDAIELEHGGMGRARSGPVISRFLSQEYTSEPSFSRLVSAAGRIGRCPVRSSLGSDCSIRDDAGPFEFPTLRREWKGSPKRMPNANRKHWLKPRFSRVCWHV